MHVVFLKLTSSLFYVV